MIFSSCYLDQIEDDTEKENTESIDSYICSQSPTTSLPDQPKDFTSLNFRDPSPPDQSEDFTPLNRYYLINCINRNRIGWPRDGTFLTLLSTVGYDFHEKNGLMVPKAGKNKVKDALVLLILELYVPSTIVIISSESAIKNTDYPSIS